MSQQDYFEQNLCKKCFIKHIKPNKNEIKNIVMTEYKDKCDKCGRMIELVDYIECETNQYY